MLKDSLFLKSKRYSSLVYKSVSGARSNGWAKKCLPRQIGM